MKPLISVITITFNSEKTIKSTLDSVNSQNYQDFEYIVIDGNSNDQTIQIINDHSVDIDSFISEDDGGIYDALNKGLEQATGEYIGILHSDDIFNSHETLQTIAKVIKNNKSQLDFIYGDLKYTDPNDYNKVVRNWKSGTFQKIKLHFGWMPPHPTVYMKRALFKKNGIYDTSFSGSADYDLMIRNLKQPFIKVHYIKECLVLMKLGGKSNKNFIELVNNLREDYQAMKNNNIFWLFALPLKKLSKLKQYIL